MINKNKISFSEKYAASNAAAEREKGAKLYFEFSSAKEQEAAKKMLWQLRDERAEFDDTFMFFDGCRNDSSRPNAFAIEIDFKKTPSGLRESIRKSLTEKGITPKEVETKLYFEFADSGTRDAARHLIERYFKDQAEYYSGEKKKMMDEATRYFRGCDIDPRRQDVGIEVTFKEDMPEIRKKIEALLVKNAAIPKEEFETVGGDPVPVGKIEDDQPKEE